MEQINTDKGENPSTTQGNKMKKPDSQKYYSNKDDMPRNALWIDGLICAFEFIRGRKKSISSRMMHMPANGQAEASSPRVDRNLLLENSSLNDFGSNEISSFDDYKYSQISQPSPLHGIERLDGSHWVPIGWARISELVQNLQVDADLTLHQFESMGDEADLTVADLAAPYWERPAGPIWWCHVYAGHPSIQAWLSNAQWLHPAVSLALKDESRLISERMKHLLYEEISLYLMFGWQKISKFLPRFLSPLLFPPISLNS